jgi:hypothetical protein
MENGNDDNSLAKRFAVVRAWLLKALLLAPLVLCVNSASAQNNMEWVRQQWRAHNYREVISPLKDYLASLKDDSREFEPDYMMATSLTGLPDYHGEGCRYFMAMVNLYNLKQRFAVAGRYVTIQSAMQGNCPQELASLNPPPPQPGVSVSPITIAVVRSAVLKQVRPPAPLGQQAVASHCSYGPGTCAQGFVWREANPRDHVCVTPQVRDQTRRDNAQAAARRSPNGGPYGPDTCTQGFVWREAFSGDHICVTPQAREQAVRDNNAVRDRNACP